jgi:hypothetical protein
MKSDFLIGAQTDHSFLAREGRKPLLGKTINIWAIQHSHDELESFHRIDEKQNK